MSLIINKIQYEYLFEIKKVQLFDSRTGAFGNPKGHFDHWFNK